MKKNTPFIILLLLSTLGFSQSFNYQAVIRNAGGDPVVNQFIGVQVQILEGVGPDTVVYTETHTVISSAQGIISLVVGTGTTSEIFSTINWNLQNQWIGIAVDITGGTTYTSIGTTKLQQVPYALFAANSGDKVFTTTANVTSNTPGDIVNDDFVFGSTQLDNDPTTINDNSKMFFDKSKGAFRVGKLRDLDPQDPEDNEPGDQWDDVNVGEESIALGNSTAAGFNAIAIGNLNNLSATAEESVAIGRGNTITSRGSLALGQSNTIDYSGSTAIGASNTSSGLGATAIGFATHAGSLAETAIGLNNTEINGTKDSYQSTDRLFVIGNGISVLQRRDALVMLKNGNTTLNGSLTIDGDNQGAGTSYTLPTQDGTANQVMTTDGSGNVSWTAASGALSTISNVTSNANGTIATDDFVFGSTQLGDTGNTDNDRRLFFDKSKGAFRAGIAEGNEWDDASIGEFSIGLGRRASASGAASVSLGTFTSALGDESVALGYAASALGLRSVAIGYRTLAQSKEQITIGTHNTIVSGDLNNWVPTDRLFVIGNGDADSNGGGSSSRSDALVMLKNGNTTLNGSLTIDGDNAGAGVGYTLPSQDGTSNQIMTTDGSGVVSWADAPTSGTTLPAGGTNGQVLQTDGAGNYSWTNNTEASGAFTALTLNAIEGWEYYNAAFGVTNFQDPRYRKVNNIVYLEGMCRKNAAINNADTIMTLPVGFRPTKTRIFSVETENGSIRVDVNANGTVLVATGFDVNQNWVSLDGITFSVD
ncbi:hypothetical protein [Aquimarina sp. 2201CG5-10]|uniref:hypothetical protein n=1 Tax=Aquimarina callyspongiae TaxID=3098150 RepID=UPI002AB5D57D|nr:hypothetical protein [Aquimarina sp. 2201CG5-10]MDY8134878.1 hypothetical protein [Aquimarina sp. 2201CG5-10]